MSCEEGKGSKSYRGLAIDVKNCPGHSVCIKSTYCKDNRRIPLLRTSIQTIKFLEEHTT
jgi:hypothetical protein